MAQLGKIRETSCQADSQRFAIIVSQFNSEITNNLFDGCIDALNKQGAKEKNIKIVYVPGAFEIPVTALKLAETKNFDAIICLGAVIRGETAHFDYVAGEAAKGIASVMLQTGVPCSFGIITTENVEQAKKRSSGRDNKGREAALTAIEMAHILSKI